MISIKKYNSQIKETWDSFIVNSKNGIFMFQRNFMEYHFNRFTDFSLLFYDDDNLIAVLPGNVLDDTIYSHQGLTFGGLIVTNEIKLVTVIECFKELSAFLRKKGIKHLIYKKIPYIYTKYPSDEDTYTLFLNNAEIQKVEPSTTIDLNNPIKISRGRKGHISKAKRNGIIVEESVDFVKYIELVNNVLQSNHNAVATHTGQELELLYSRFPNNIKLLVAKYNNEIIAGVLLFIYEDLVHTQYLAANDFAKDTGALDLIIKTIIDTYTNQKHFLDFGISSENGGRILNSGLMFQKEGFGARTVSHITYKIDF